ncbi:ABC transporter permease [Candidatus Desulfarcum epimagneticum]|uniref:ABC transporter permease n=1 Tax=uncultured Desulfobacteraceae bacterium TaxID=218296 RepID=A0A484HKW2_9BACT|nr:ABC transporter permease [uncultured Desulfobacteraceae bacterium]
MSAKSAGPSPAIYGLMRKPPPLLSSVFRACAAAGAAFAFAALALFLAGADPVDACFLMLKGSLGSWGKFARVIQVWIPLVLCACGLLFTFRMNLWNIGVEGQMIVGAVCATALLRMGPAVDFPALFLCLSFFAGAAGGALWAMVAGFLKTKGGVNEIFAGLGLNFVAQGLVLWLIFGKWRRPGSASMSGTALFEPGLWLSVWPNFRISPAGLALALAAIAAAGFVLNRARIGLHFRAIGENRAAAFLLGARPARLMIIGMVLAGGFAGLAGTVQVTGVYHRLIPAISSNYGYLALLVAMLSNYGIRMVPVVAFFFACLNVGSIQLPMVLQIDSSLSGVIQGALVLAALGARSWHDLKHTRRAE